MLKVNNQVWCRDPTALKTHIDEFYRPLYTSMGERDIQSVLKQCPCIVREKKNENLSAQVSMEEVEVAALQLGGTKAQGPKGLSRQFYQYYQKEVCADIFQTVCHFFELGVFDPQINRTHIVLIPKTGTLEKN